VHPLEGCRLKLARGDEHVKAFKNLTRRRSEQEGSPVLLREKVDFDASEISVLVDSVVGLPLSLGLSIGDAIHNYRSALDQLIFELAFVDSGGVERERTAFPASLTFENFSGSYVQQRMLEGLMVKHKTMLKRFQPYRTRRASRHRHPIAVLDDLSNDDKHRLIQPALYCPNEIVLAFPPGGLGRHCRWDTQRKLRVFSVLGRPLDPGTEIFRLPVEITGPNPQMHVKCHGEFFIGFRNGVPADGALVAIGRMTREIIDTFAPEFETKKALKVRDKPRLGRFHEIPPERFGVRVVTKKAAN
jgi:hypothetical protein